MMETTVAETTYEFRWDVEVTAEGARFGERFLKQWQRVLQVQKLAVLVKAGLSPCEARFQLCVEDDAEDRQITRLETEVAEKMRLLWKESGVLSHELAGHHPAGWQGVRVWMTFPRRDVEIALAKKSKV